MFGRAEVSATGPPSRNHARITRRARWFGRDQAAISDGIGQFRVKGSAKIAPYLVEVRHETKILWNRWLSEPVE
jgi:hypothetical protein